MEWLNNRLGAFHLHLCCCILLVFITQSHCFMQTSRLSLFISSIKLSSPGSSSLSWNVQQHKFKKYPSTSILSMSSQQQQQQDQQQDQQTSPSSPTSSTSSTSSTPTPPLYIDLTPQERILKEALGIEPETPAEKQSRQNKRIAELQKIQNEKRKNVIVAIFAFSAACLNYFWQYTHPVTSLQLLTDMQRNSDDVALIGKNGKPTVVDFWAPWCENCKSAAPTLSFIEDEYRNKVNFVMVNGDLRESWPLIERFGVDAIPHLAMIGSDGYVETALIGPIPRSVLEADLDVMIENGKRRNLGVSITSASASTSTSGDLDGQQQQQQQDVGKIQLPYDVDSSSQQEEGKIQLPYTMYDAFRSRPDLRKVSF